MQSDLRICSIILYARFRSRELVAVQVYGCHIAVYASLPICVNNVCVCNTPLAESVTIEV